MKRIITSIALVALAAPLSAMTPSELIEKIRHHVDVHEVHRTQPRTQHHPIRQQTKRTHKAAPAKRVRRAHKKTQKNISHASGTKRMFHTLSEYRHGHHVQRYTPKKTHHAVRHAPRHHAVPGQKKLSHYVGNGWFVDERGQYDEQYQAPTDDPYLWVPSQVRRQHAYRHYRRQWYLTYLYECSEFDDQHGYHYGYFDRRGFVFDGAFYLYDRSYTYQDRLHGKGLFEHRFYRPIQRYTLDTYADHWESESGDAHVALRWSF